MALTNKKNRKKRKIKYHKERCCSKKMYQTTGMFKKKVDNNKSIG